VGVAGFVGIGVSVFVGTDVGDAGDLAFLCSLASLCLLGVEPNLLGLVLSLE
jgi:hypothetical protein